MCREKEKRSSWKSIMEGLARGIIGNIENDVSERMKRFAVRMGEKMAGALLMLTGLVFLLVSISLLINNILSGKPVWIGWGIVGLAAMAIGYLISRK